MSRGGQCSLFLMMRCFQIINDAIFRRCFEENIDLDVLTMFKQSWNIVLTMHISDVFGNNFKLIENCSKSFEICDKLLVSLSWLSETEKDVFPNTSLICIVSTMFHLCSNMVKNIQVDVFFKTLPKHRMTCFWQCLKKKKTLHKRTPMHELHKFDYF